jgi:hypothetical protein
MSLILNGTNGVSDVDGSASTPAIRGTDTNTGIFFPAADTIAFAEGGAEVARFNSSGDFGIGETSPAAPLHIKSATNNIMRLQSSDATTGNLYFTFYNSSGTQKGYIGYGNSGDDALQIQNEANSYMTFATNGSERMRITSDGQLLVNRTSAEGSSTIVSKSLGTDSYQGFNTNNSFTFAVSGSGTIYAVNTAVQTISDIRLKENIQDIDVGLDAVMQLKPRKFDWKAGKGKDIKGDIGWVAQEFEQVFPKMIGEWREPAPQGEEPYKSIGADLMPILVKAIQEQQTIITDLKSRIEALEVSGANASGTSVTQEQV